MSRPRLIWLYVAVLAGAAAAVTMAEPQLGSTAPGHRAWLALPVLAVLVGLAEFLLVRYRYGDEVDALNLVEAILAPLVFAFSGPLVVAAVAAGQIGAAAYRRNEPIKAAFNVAQWSLAAALGSLTVGLLADGSGTSWRNLAALLAGMLVIGITNQVAFSGLMTILQQGSGNTRGGLAPVLVPGWLGAFSVNALFGILYVLAYDAHPASVLLFALPLVILNRAYLGHAAAASDRARLLGLHRAAHSLNEPIDPRDAIGPFLREVAEVFDAQGTALVVRSEDGLHIHRLTDGPTGEITSSTEPEGTPSFEAALAAQPWPAYVVAGGDTPLSAALAKAGWRDCLYAPLMDDGLISGAIMVLDQVGVESVSAGQLAVLEALARETAATLAKGRLLETMLSERLAHLRLAEALAAQRVVVEQLQQAVMPDQPVVAGAQLGVCYEPSDPTSPTGGDLFDWQTLPSGELHVAVVDVIGHGVEATKDALSVVHALRLVAFDGTPLEEMVGRVDALLGAQHPDLVATVVVARFDPMTGVVRVASGGHPPALVVSAGGEVHQVVATGGAVGWPGAGSDSVATVRLALGDALVLYTDGLVEARKDILEGMESLLVHAAELAPLPPEEFATELVARSLAGAERRDDSLALVLRRTPVDAPSPSRRWRIDPTPAEVPVVRRELVEWAAALGVQGDDLALVATELLSNGVRVARSSVSLSALLGEDEIVIEVSDDGPGDPRLPSLGMQLPHPDSLDGRGLAIVRALSVDVSAMSTPEGSVVRSVLRIAAFADVTAPAHALRRTASSS